MERQYDSIYDRIFINENVPSFWPKDMHKDKDVYSGVWDCVKLETVVSGHKSRSEDPRSENPQPLRLKMCELFYLLWRESDHDP